MPMGGIVTGGRYVFVRPVRKVWSKSRSNHPDKLRGKVSFDFHVSSLSASLSRSFVSPKKPLTEIPPVTEDDQQIAQARNRKCL